MHIVQRRKIAKCIQHEITTKIYALTKRKQSECSGAVRCEQLHSSCESPHIASHDKWHGKALEITHIILIRIQE